MFIIYLRVASSKFLLFRLVWSTLSKGELYMAKTCIVCGGPAGSGEHVFPASLGGRRTNRGIYCLTHDNGYSYLVSELAGQLDVFNSLLGVRPDHSRDIKSVRGRYSDGRDIELSAKASKFAGPRVFSQEPRGEGALFQMAFPDLASMNRWRAEQEALGRTVTVEKTGEPSTYFVGPVHFSRAFGGRDGLAAVAYVSQTFLAQEFPELARSQGVKDFIRFTQIAAKARKKSTSENMQIEGMGAAASADAPIWWDFEPKPDVAPNHFSFGHRVTVGVDADDGLIYGRLSFFSSVHFSMVFGVAPDARESKAVTIDIDPLAEHPPKDIARTERFDALMRVERPRSQTAGLAQAIASDDASRLFDDLMMRMSAHSLAKTASEMSDELAEASCLSQGQIERRIADIVEARSQRILNLMLFFVRDFKKSAQGRRFQKIWPIIDTLVELDPMSTNGLSRQATAFFHLAKQAILSTMLDDYKNGRLNERRFAELMGEGPGLAIVGKAILQPVLGALPTGE